MPKEVTHWLIAQQTAAVLQGSALGDLAASYPNCLHLGAVLHDAAFYARNRRWKDAMAEFANMVHGRGRDPFDIIRSMTQAATQARHPAPVRALIIGMLTHMAADSTFHPLVYHETGNYHDPDPARRTLAVQRHRSFETTLDVYLAGTVKNIRTYSLKRYMRCSELRLSRLIREAFTPAARDFNCPQLPAALLHSLKVFRRMQSLFAAPFMTHMLDTIYPLLNSPAREIAALFYLPRFVKKAPGLHGRRTVPDTATGCSSETTVLELYSRAVSTARHLCREMEGALLGTAPFSVPQMRIIPDPHIHTVHAAQEDCSHARSS